MIVCVGFIQGCSGSGEGLAPSSAQLPSEDEGTDTPSDSVPEDPVVTGASDLNLGLAYGWKKSDGSANKLTFTKTSGALKYECRTAKESSINSASYSNCDGTSEGRAGFTLLSEPASADRSGSYQTDVRTTASDGSTSTSSYKWYAHETLTNVDLCSEIATDADFFSKASEVLSMSQTFTGSGTKILSGKVTLPFQSGQVNVLSLRKHFSLNSGRSLLLVKRAYPSRFSSSCELAVHIGIRNNIQPNEELSTVNCHAVVANATGQAVCLRKDGSSITVHRTISNLKNKYSGGANHTRTASSKHFSPKTTDSNITTDTLGLGSNHLLYMPE